MDVADTLLVDNEPFEVGRAAAWLDRLLEGAGLSPRAIAELQVALDEVLNNILVHGYADLEAHKIELRLTANDGAATLEFVDDGIPFDPTRHQVPPAGDNTIGDNTIGANTGMRPGGLGLVFVRRLMDDMTYERVGDRNHLTLRKILSL